MSNDNVHAAPSLTEEEYAMHYGILRKSGRYPWGSGGTEVERANSFLTLVSELRKEGLTEAQIAEKFSSKEEPFNSSMLRATTTIANNKARADRITTAERLKAKGMSNGAIAQQMGLPGESSVRALLEPGVKLRTDELNAVAGYLKNEVDTKGFVDVGIGNELYLGVSRTKMDTALSMMKSEGYWVDNVQVDQLGTNGKTTVKVAAPPGTTYKDVVSQQDKIYPIGVQKADALVPQTKPAPISFDSKRLDIVYGEKGEQADGVMYIRPGKDDVSLGDSRYAQVRVLVDGTHYIKGMATYKDDLPDGIDIQFNTNKTDSGSKLDALKKIKDDPNDPFGTITNPVSTKPNSVMNIVNEEGQWGKWSKSLATQVLSKQKPSLAKELLDKRYDEKKTDYDEIMALTNPAVRRKLLESLADDIDAHAIHLKAAHLPRQATQVILPLDPTKIKQSEIYAPNFKDGERVVLIRYPHGGKFEIPELTVNNKNPEGIKILGTQPKDAVGIHPETAKKLSGADFDGDTVLVIPNNSGKIKSQSALKDLQNFEPRIEYAPYDGMRTIDGGTWNAKEKKVDYGVDANGKPKVGSGKKKQTEMGKVSNLITDMTIKGASDQEIARAVRHSMVVIDAEKHHLNYQASAVNNGIGALKQRYQGGANRGATTLISRTKSRAEVPERKATVRIDPLTGKKVYIETGASYVNKNGKLIVKTTRTTQGAKVDDAHKLSSGTKIEEVYADHSNRLRSLGDQTRLSLVQTKSMRRSPSAAKTYADEVANLKAQLNVALKNAPRERQAQLLANASVKAKLQSNPQLTPDEVKKLKGRELTAARVKTGAKKDLVKITPRAWEAIQAGAISNKNLEDILNNTDIDVVKALATPRKPSVMTGPKVARAQALLSAGRTPSEVAQILGVPLSTLTSSLSEGG